MKLKDGLTLRTICNQHMIVDLCDDVVNMTNVYTLNDVAAWLWSTVQVKGKFYHSEREKKISVGLKCSRCSESW